MIKNSEKVILNEVYKASKISEKALQYVMESIENENEEFAYELAEHRQDCVDIEEKDLVLKIHFQKISIS